MNARYALRKAKDADAGEIARHRGQMFLDMGLVRESEAVRLINASVSWFQNILLRGEYQAWVVEFEQRIIAGAGLHLSENGPLPGCFRMGRAAHIANVYTHPAHRKQGVARALLEEMLRWCQVSRIDQVTLTASSDGRALYTSLGFEGQPDGMVRKLNLQDLSES